MSLPQPSSLHTLSGCLFSALDFLLLFFSWTWCSLSFFFTPLPLCSFHLLPTWQKILSLQFSSVPICCCIFLIPLSWYVPGYLQKEAVWGSWPQLYSHVNTMVEPFQPKRTQTELLNIYIFLYRKLTVNIWCVKTVTGVSNSCLEVLFDSKTSRNDTTFSSSCADCFVGNVLVWSDVQWVRFWILWDSKVAFPRGTCRSTVGNTW